jgi:cytochrome P450
VVEASRHPAVFSSGGGGATPDVPAPFAEYFGSLINLDDPRHARLRRIVARAFTVRTVRRLEERIAVIVAETVDRLVRTGPCDFVDAVAAPIPLRVICELMGIPAGLHQYVLDRSRRVVAGFDPEYSAGPAQAVAGLLAAARDLHDLAAGLAGERQRHPTGDLVSALVTADVDGDGERLTPAELGSFFILLAVAGNETTRHALSAGLALLTRHPDQRALWLSDLDRHTAPAVEEILRLASPVNFMRRELTADHTLGGHRFRAGDEVRLYYRAANRDEAVFTRPDLFDITRAPNPHVAFGGPGPHFCLGANLARRELQVTFRHLLTRLPEIRGAGEPDLLLSSFINGIKHYACTPC